MGVCRLLAAVAVAVMPLSAGLGINAPAYAAKVGDTIEPADFFPKSDLPHAMRERLANRLLGKSRITHPAFDDYYARIAKELAEKDDYLLVTAAPREVNAFAHYGGVVVMMRGMWEYAKNEDTLVGIIAHEIGHVRLDHFESKRKLNETISALTVPLMIAGLLAGSPEVREGIIVGGSGIITGQIYGHSRELEHEADVVGLQLLKEAKRDGLAVADLLGGLAAAPSEYISTHPAPARRAAYIKDRLLGAPDYAMPDSLDFMLLREILAVYDGVSSDFIPNKRRDLKTAAGDKKTALQFGLFLALASGGKSERAEAELMAAELAAHPHPFILAAVGDYFSRRGKHQHALSLLNAAQQKHPQSAVLAVRQIESLRRAGKHKHLAKTLEKLPPSLAQRADILREASQSASALRQHARANLLLARAHLGQGEFELARRQLEIAEKFKMDTKQLVEANKLQNQIEKELSGLDS